MATTPQRLIAELRGEGRVDSTGEFTLDRDKAREKMRQFQLADARQYVLFLVQAAVLKGARRVDFAIDADDMVLTCDGRPFTVEDFDQVYGALFSKAADDDTRARRELALGLNAAMALHPRWIRVTSGDGTTGTQLELRPERPDAFGPLAPAPRGTRIHVKARFRPGLAVRFVRNIRGTLAEEVWLAQRCTHAPIPIVLEGRRLSQDMKGGFLPDALVREPFEGPELEGVATIGRAPTAGRLHFATNGVRIVTHDDDELPDGCECIVDCPRLRKDASQADVVHDDTYVAVVLAAAKACSRALARLARDFAARKLAADDRKAAERILFRALLSRSTYDFRPLLDGGAEPAEPCGPLADAPLWRAITGANLSLRRIAGEVIKRGACLYTTTRQDPVALEDGRPVLLLDQPEELDFLQRYLEEKLEEATARLERARQRGQRRKEWLSRIAEPRLGGGPDRIVSPLDTRGIDGEIGVPDAPSAEVTRIRLVAQGCLLGTRRVQLPTPAVEAVMSAEFAPDPTYSDVCNDGSLVAAVLAFLDGWDPFVRQLILRIVTSRRPPTIRQGEFLRQYLRAFLDPGLADAALAAFGFFEIDRPALLAAAGVGPETYVPRLGVGRFRAPALPAAPANGARRPDGGDVHPVARERIFPAHPQRWVSLCQIQEEIDRAGVVEYVGMALPGGATERPFLLELDADQRGILETIFGPAALRDVTEEISRDAGAQAHARREEERPEVCTPVLARVPVAAPGLVGELAAAAPGDVLPFGPLWPPSARLRLLKNRRFLVDKVVPAPIGPLVGAFDVEDLAPNAAWTDVAEDQAMAKVRSAVVDAAGPLVGELCRSLAAAAAGPRERIAGFLLEAAAAAFPTPTFRRAWDVLCATEELPTAVALYARLLRLSARRCLDDVVCSLDRLLAGAGDTPHRSAAAKRLRAALDELEVLGGAAHGPPAQEVDLFAAWLADPGVTTNLPVPGVLRDAPLLRTRSDRLSSLAEVAEVRRRGKRIRFIDLQERKGPDGEELVVRLSTDTAAVLRRLFEEHAIAKAAPDLPPARGGTPRAPEPAPEPASVPVPAPEPAAIQATIDGPKDGGGPRAAVDWTPVIAEPEVLLTPAPPATPSSPTAADLSSDPAQELSARRERFLGALRTAVRTLRSLLPPEKVDARLDRLVFGDGREDQVVTCTDDVTCVHLRHPAVRRALESFDGDPVVLVFLVSAIWSAINYWSEAVTNEEEEAVQLRLAERANDSSNA
jgi:hypothetical protein